MNITSQAVVFDAPDLDAESSFWATLLGGTVNADSDWHTVLVDGQPRIDVQLAPDHIAPDWPANTIPQQIHLDITVTDIERRPRRGAGRRRAIAPGRRPHEGFRVRGLRRSGGSPVLPLLVTSGATSGRGVGAAHQSCIDPSSSRFTGR